MKVIMLIGLMMSSSITAYPHSFHGEYNDEFTMAGYSGEHIETSYLTHTEANILQLAPEKKSKVGKDITISKFAQYCSSCCIAIDNVTQ